MDVYKQRKCDQTLMNMVSPPPEPEKKKPPRVRKPREWKLPPKFALLTDLFYSSWCSHQKQLQMMRPIVDDSPPPIFPELYLKPRRLNYYAHVLEATMIANKEMIKRINDIQKTGGYVDCWTKPGNEHKLTLLQRKARQKELDKINLENVRMYHRFKDFRSDQLCTKELDEEWKHTKVKLVQGAKLPFILFKTGRIDKDMKDPHLEKPLNYPPRTKVMMDFRVRKGAKLGKVIIELFTDTVPKACHIFLTLIKGDGEGHSYTGTRIFRVVPDLYCRGGDVLKDNGFGAFLPQGFKEYPGPENFKLNHSVPGVVSMAVSSDGEIYGQYNIIFKPLPQFNGQHVVFGRIIGGPPQTLERISALGLPLGTTVSDIMVAQCGFFTRSGVLKEGLPCTVKFLTGKKDKP